MVKTGDVMCLWGEWQPPKFLSVVPRLVFKVLQIAWGKHRFRIEVLNMATFNLLPGIIGIYKGVCHCPKNIWSSFAHVEKC